MPVHVTYHVNAATAVRIDEDSPQHMEVENQLSSDGGDAMIGSHAVLLN